MGVLTTEHEPGFWLDGARDESLPGSAQVACTFRLTSGPLLAAQEHARQRAEAEAERVAALVAQLAHVRIGEAIVRGE